MPDWQEANRQSIAIVFTNGIISPMMVRDLLSGSELPHLDRELILGLVMRKKRSWLFANPEFELSVAQADQFFECEIRRFLGEPMAYILGEKEFYGRSFEVNESVLIPRSSTECLVDLALDYFKKPFDCVRQADGGVVCFSKKLKDCREIDTVIDIGTGCGCIAVTLALERHDLKVIATDICDAALRTAEINAIRHGVSGRIDFRIGNLLDPVMDVCKPFLLISNPPYVPGDGAPEIDVYKYEPYLSLFAGAGGMDVLNPLVTQAKTHPMCCGFAIECMEEQANKLLSGTLFG